MNYVIENLADFGVIKITVWGTINQDIRKEILSEAVSKLTTNGYHKLLMDLIDAKISEKYTSRTVNTFEMVDSIKKIETKNPFKIAVLSKVREDDRKHFVKLAQAIGKLNTKHFSNYDEAISWLFGKDIFT